MLCGCGILVKHPAKCLHNNGRNLHARLLFAEIKLTDLILCLRIDNDNARLICNQNTSRLIGRDISQTLVKIRQTNRTCYHACYTIVV